MPNQSALARLETALRAASRQYADDLRRAEARQGAAHELSAVFLRLGIGADRLDRLDEGPSALPVRLRREIADRLQTELMRLARAARSNRYDYDINRHLAVRRAARWLGDEPDSSSPGDSGHRPSGRELNARFRRKVPRNRRAVAGRQPS